MKGGTDKTDLIHLINSNMSAIENINNDLQKSWQNFTPVFTTSGLSYSSLTVYTSRYVDNTLDKIVSLHLEIYLNVTSSTTNALLMFEVPAPMAIKPNGYYSGASLGSGYLSPNTPQLMMVRGRAQDSPQRIQIQQDTHVAWTTGGNYLATQVFYERG